MREAFIRVNKVQVFVRKKVIRVINEFRVNWRTGLLQG